MEQMIQPPYPSGIPCVYPASHADTKLTLLASNVTGSASWSPRGTHAAYASPKGVHVFHMQDKAILHSVEMLGGAVESVAWVAAGRILIGSRIVIQVRACLARLPLCCVQQSGVYQSTSLVTSSTASVVSSSIRGRRSLPRDT